MLASKFINCLMYDGKKSVAQQAFYDALDEIGRRIPTSRRSRSSSRPWRTSSRPSKSAPSASAAPLPGPDAGQPEPAAVAGDPLDPAGRPRRQEGSPDQLKLGRRADAAYNREGAAMTRRDNVHRMADANKAFAHFAW
jgi:small subunit ribosomal protein S7